MSIQETSPDITPREQNAIRWLDRHQAIEGELGDNCRIIVELLARLLKPVEVIK